MKIRRVVLEDLAEGHRSLGVALGNPGQARIFRLRGPLVRECYVVALLDETETAELIAVWDADGRPGWVNPRVVTSEGLYHLIKRGAWYVRNGWSGVAEEDE